MNRNSPVAASRSSSPNNLPDGRAAPCLIRPAIPERRGQSNHQSIPKDATIILPFETRCCFRAFVLPLTIARPSSIAAVQEAVRGARSIGLLLQDDPNIEQPGPEHLRRVGTIAEILRYVTSEQTHYVICRGLRRFPDLENFSRAIHSRSRASRRSAYPR